MLSFSLHAMSLVFSDIQSLCFICSKMVNNFLGKILRDTTCPENFNIFDLIITSRIFLILLPTDRNAYESFYSGTKKVKMILFLSRVTSRSFLGKESVSMETVFPGNTQLPGVRRGALFGLSGMVMVSLDRPQRSVCQRK